MSWNSSTMISAKRSDQRRRSSGSAASRSRTPELEVLEVEPCALRLGLGIALAEALEQHRDLLERRARVMVRAALPVGGERSAVRLARRLPQRLCALLELGRRERGRRRHVARGQHALAGVERRDALLDPAAGCPQWRGGVPLPPAQRSVPRRRAPARVAGRAARAASRRASAASRGRSARSRGGSGPYAAATSIAGAPRSRAQSSNARSYASPASRSAAGSSSTSKRGSRPAASGRARRMRAQKPWIVPIQPASTARAVSSSPSATKRRRMRSRSSPAAFSVNVRARIEPTGTPSCSTASTQRSAITAVLPEPALAASSAEPRTVLDRRSLLRREGHAHPPARQIVGYAQPLGEQRSAQGAMRPPRSASAVVSARSRISPSASSSPASSTTSVPT